LAFWQCRSYRKSKDVAVPHASIDRDGRTGWQEEEGEGIESWRGSYISIVMEKGEDTWILGVRVGGH
jgi:hypothetical protein